MFLLSNKSIVLSRDEYTHIYDQIGKYADYVLHISVSNTIRVRTRKHVRYVSLSKQLVMTYVHGLFDCLLQYDICIVHLSY